MANFFTIKPQHMAVGLILLGAIFVSVSVDYQNLFFLLAGVTIILWGGLLFYIKPEEMVPIIMLYDLASNLYEELDSRFAEIKISGKPTYYGGRSLEDIEEIKVKINLYEGGEINISPPGYNVQKTIEKRMGINFNKKNLKDIPLLLKKVIKEELFLCHDMEFNFIDDNKINVNIDNGIFSELYSKYSSPSLVGDPIVSAFACIIARSTGDSILIDTISKSSSRVNALYIRQKYNSTNEVKQI